MIERVVEKDDPKRRIRVLERGGAQRVDEPAETVVETVGETVEVPVAICPTIRSHCWRRPSSRRSLTDERRETW